MAAISTPITGNLSLVSTPIGNLEDMTYRAVRTLREADLVAAEDTRRAQILLNHYEIRVATTAYHAHNERGRTAGLLDRVMRGDRVALLTDAGTPSISDPGFLLVREALAMGIEPNVVPGVSALTTAAVACGFPVSELLFAGYLANKGRKRSTALARLAGGCQTLLLFESPYRIEKLLKEIVDTLGPDTPVALLRELTKLHEERLRGSAAELLAATKGKKWKGEFTIAIHCAVVDPDAISTDSDSGGDDDEMEDDGGEEDGDAKGE